MAPPGLSTGQHYKNRRENCVVLNITIDKDAAEILRKYCPPGHKGTGKFIARLLYEHDAKQQVCVAMRAREI